MDPQPLVQIGYILSVGAGAVVRARDALHVRADALHGCVAQPLQGTGRPKVWWHLYNANTTAPRQGPRTNRYVTIIVGQTTLHKQSTITILIIPR